MVRASGAVWKILAVLILMICLGRISTFRNLAALGDGQ